MTLEDYYGKRVVLGTNDYGLGRWATIVDAFEVKDEDEDGAHYNAVIEVEFTDGASPRCGWMSYYEAERQLGPAR